MFLIVGTGFCTEVHQIETDLVVANIVNKSIEQSDNEFDIFVKSVAVQLNNMPLDMTIEAERFM